MQSPSLDYVRSIGTLTQTRSIATQTSECDTEEIPKIILTQAVRIVDTFDCEICNEGLRAIHLFLRDILPNKVLTIKDELLIYLKKNNLQNLKSKLMIKLSKYFKDKISNILKDLWKENKINEEQYLNLMKSLKRACGLPAYY